MSTRLAINKQIVKQAFDLLDYNQEGKVNIASVIEIIEKMGYDKTHPELYDLFNSLDGDKIDYNEFLECIKDIMNQKDEDAGLQRMYDLLVYNPKIEEIDFDTFKKISEETGHNLTDKEIKFALKEIGNGKTISIESFIKFMKE